MKPILNEQLIDKYILDEFGNIPNPPTKNEMIESINNDNLTLDEVKLWYLFGGDLNIEGIYSKSILHSSSWMGQLDIVEYVLDKGIDVECLNDKHSTPLMFASERGYIKVINYLLDKGANINYQNRDVRTALHYACVWNKLNVVKILVERDADIYLKDLNNQNALDIAKAKHYQKIIDYLTPFYK